MHLPTSAFDFLLSEESAPWILTPSVSLTSELAVANLDLRKGDGGMCEGPGKSDTHPSQCDKEFSLKGKPGSQSEDPCSYLLELAAVNDVENFQKFVEQGLAKVDGVGNWYVRQNGSKRMALEQRTPAMVAASYGSMDVLKYVLKAYVAFGGDINQTCGSDGTTALHCAVAGCSAFAVDAAKLLVDAGADVNLVDANGRTLGDIIAVSYRTGDEKRPALEEVLVMRRKAWENADDLSEYFQGCVLPSSVTCGEAGESSAGSSPFGGSGSSSSSSPKSPQVTGSKLLADGTEKTREYPNDPSLPDIKNSIYTTDEFRMYTFKVRPCSRAYSHDWTECPFVHPGENARRRDPRRYHYSCVPCPDFRKGACRRGDACEYAHGVFECWLHPAQYRTRLCKDGTDCNRRVCFFAHTSDELRSLYVSTGSALPSPRPSACLDMSMMSPPLTPGSPLMMPPFSPSYSVQGAMQGCLGTPPMSPQSTSANALSGSLSMSQSNMPTLQLPGASLQTSRLRAALSARDVQLNDSMVFNDFDGEMMGEFQSLSAQSLSTQARLNAAVAASVNNGIPSSRAGKYRSLGLTVAPSNLEDMFASESVSSPKSLGHESSLLSQYEAQMQSGSQFPNQVSVQLQLQAHQAALEAQLQGVVLHSPKKSTSFSLGPLSRMSPHNKIMDPENQCLKEAISHSPALAAARASFAQRDKHSYSSRDLGASLLWSDWGSPTGKPEWSVQGDDLCKLRKSASMGMRATDEPDLSWVQTLVKEGPMDVDSKELPNICGDDGASSLQREGADTSLIGSWIDKLHLDRIMA